MKFSISPYAAVFAVFCAWLGKLQAYCVAMACILMHECAHAMVCDLLGHGAGAITLHPFGASLTLQKPLDDPKTELAVAFAGPFASLVLAMFFYMLFLWRDLSCFRLFYLYHAAFGLFNLMPALPMDGGRILRAALTEPLGAQRALAISAWLGVFTGCVLCLISVAAWRYYRVNAVLLCSGIALIVSALREKRQASGYVLDVYQKQNRLQTGGVMPIRVLAVSKNTPLYAIVRQLQRETLTRIEIYDERMRLVGNCDETALVGAAAQLGKDACAKYLCR